MYEPIACQAALKARNLHDLPQSVKDLSWGAPEVIAFMADANATLEGQELEIANQVAQAFIGAQRVLDAHPELLQRALRGGPVASDPAWPELRDAIVLQGALLPCAHLPAMHLAAAFAVDDQLDEAARVTERFAHAYPEDPATAAWAAHKLVGLVEAGAPEPDARLRRAAALASQVPPSHELASEAILVEAGARFRIVLRGRDTDAPELAQDLEAFLALDFERIPPAKRKAFDDVRRTSRAILRELRGYGAPKKPPAPAEGAASGTSRMVFAGVAVAALAGLALWGFGDSDAAQRARSEQVTERTLEVMRAHKGRYTFTASKPPPNMEVTRPTAVDRGTFEGTDDSVLGVLNACFDSNGHALIYNWNVTGPHDFRTNVWCVPFEGEGM